MVKSAFAGVTENVKVGVDAASLADALAKVAAAAAAANPTTNVKSNADKPTLAKALADIGAQLKAFEAAQQFLIESGVDEPHLTAALAELKAKLAALQQAAGLLKIGVKVDEPEVAAALAQLKADMATFQTAINDTVGDANTLRPALDAVAASMTKVDAATKDTNTSSGIFWGWLAGLNKSIPLFGGSVDGAVTHVKAWHLALDSIVELGAIFGPALTAMAAGLAAFALAGVDAATKVYNRMLDIHTAFDAVGNSMKGLTGSITPLNNNLETMHEKIQPAIFQLFGDAIDVARSKTGLFNDLATKTASVIDTMAAHLTVDMTKSGTAFSAFVKTGEDDLKLLGDILLNVGALFGKLMQAAAQTHIAEDLLTIVDAASKVLSIVGEIPTPFLAAALAAHGLWLWGGLLTTGFTNVLNAVLKLPMGIATAVSGISSTETAVAKLAADATPMATLVATVKDVGTAFSSLPAGITNSVGALIALGTGLKGVGDDAGIAEKAIAAMKGLLVAMPWIPLVAGITAAIGAFVALVAIGEKGTTTVGSFTDSLDKMVAKSNDFTLMGNLIGAMATNSEKLSSAQNNLNSSYTNVTGGATRFGQALNTTAAQVSSSSNEQTKLQGQLSATFSHLTQVSQKYGVDLPAAMGLAQQAGVSVQELMTKSNTTWEQAAQKIDGLVKGFDAMGQHGGMLGADINALTIHQTDNIQAVQKLNSAYDDFLKMVQGPITGFQNVDRAVIQFNSDALVAGARMDGLGGPVQGMAKKVTTASLQLQQDFTAVVNASQPMIDSLRTAASITGDSGPVVKGINDTIAVLIPMAGKSEAARVQIQALAQQAGEGGLSFDQLKAKVSGVQNPIQDLQTLTTKAAASMVDLGKDAAALSNTLQSSMNQALVSQADKVYDLTGKTKAYMDAVHQYGPNSQQANAALSTLSDTQTKINTAVKDGAAQLPALTGNVKGYGTAAQGTVAQISASDTASQSLVNTLQKANVPATTIKTDMDNYTASLQKNGAEAPQTQAAQEKLTKDLTDNHVPATQAKTDTDNYANSMLQLAAQQAKNDPQIQAITKDLTDSHVPSSTAKTDVDNLVTSWLAYGQGSPQWNTAVQNLTNAMNTAHVPTSTQTQLTNDLTNALKGLPPQTSVSVTETGTGSFSIAAQVISGALPPAANAPALTSPSSQNVPTGQMGMRIPGWGGGDVVPALLEPGETVVPKELTAAIAPLMKAHGVPGFQYGAVVPGVVTQVAPYSGSPPAGMGAWVTSAHETNVNNDTALMELAILNGAAQAAAAYNAAAGYARGGLVKGYDQGGLVAPSSTTTVSRTSVIAPGQSPFNINFYGTQYPSAEQMAAIRREFGHIVGAYGGVLP